MTKFTKRSNKYIYFLFGINFGYRLKCRFYRDIATKLAIQFDTLETR